MRVVAGIDLAGSEKRPTGIAFLGDGEVLGVKVVYTDDEMVTELLKVRPVAVGIDAPLSVPKGRKSIEDPEGPHFRSCDLELRRRKIRFFPITLGPMRKLTNRGIRIKEMLLRLNFKVFEVYPGATQDILGIPRKSKGLEELRKGLVKLGLKNLKKELSGDELDAITAALTVQLFLEGEGELIGDEEEGLMLLPRGD